MGADYVPGDALDVVEALEASQRGRRILVVDDNEDSRHLIDSLLSPLGFSPTGETFNLTMEDVACSAAIALHADKLIFITETDMMTDAGGTEIRELSSHQAEAVLQAGFLPDATAFYLKHCVKACNNGVDRSHIVPFAMDGSALLELFTHDGVGTMISHENLESLRQ
eukprot:gene52206-71173_t